MKSIVQNYLNHPEKLAKYYSLVYFLAPLLIFGRAIFLGKALFWGTPILQFIPWRHLAVELLMTGILPLWNPYVGMGAPLLANYQSALLYPPNWITFILDIIGGVSWMAWGHTLLVVIHLGLAGLGVSKLSKMLGVNIIGQLISGLSFGMSLYLVSRTGFFSMTAAIAWMPWVVYYATPRYYSGVSIRDAIINYSKLVLVMTMLLLAGHAQLTAYILLFTLAWCLFLWINGWGIAHNLDQLINTKTSKNIFLRNSLALLFCAILHSIMLSSIQLLPTYEYLSQSQRVISVAYTTVATYSFWPWRLITIIAPDMFGNPANGNYWGYGNYWEDALYFGTLPLILALIGVIKGISNNKLKNFSSTIFNSSRLYVFLLVVIIVSMVIALGINTPLFGYLYSYAPIFKMFQAPTRITLIVVLCLSLLAGIGLDGWKKPTNKCLYWMRLSVAAAFAISFGAVVSKFLFKDINPTYISAIAKSGILIGISCLFLLFIPSDGVANFHKRENNKSFRKTRIWGILLIIFVGVDLVLAGWNLNPFWDASLYQTIDLDRNIEKIKEDNGRLFIHPSDEYYLKYEKYFNFNNFKAVDDWLLLRREYLANMNSLDHIYLTNNYDPLLPERFQKWLNLLSESIEQNNIELSKNMLNLGNVHLVKGMIFKQTEVDLNSLLIKNKMYKWIPCGIQASTGEDAFEMLEKSNIDLERNVIIENINTHNIGSCAMGVVEYSVEQNKIDVIKATPNETHLITKTQEDGFLFISTVWYPGWEASINGKSTPILRANYLFQAIHIPSGENEVIIAYHPTSFYIGCIVSFGSLLIVFLLLFYVKSGNTSHG